MDEEAQWEEGLEVLAEGEGVGEGEDTRHKDGKKRKVEKIAIVRKTVDRRLREFKPVKAYCPIRLRVNT